MHWQDACLRSKDKKAFRRTSDGRIVIRFWDGGGCIETHFNSLRRVSEATDWELEGFLDWEPLTPIKGGK